MAAGHASVSAKKQDHEKNPTIVGFFHSVLDDVDGTDGTAAGSARFFFLSPSFLKSVSYQPAPANRKLGAVTCRDTLEAPQEGQIDGSTSESFCSRSN
jgi:hypothetical protein